METRGHYPPAPPAIEYRDIIKKAPIGTAILGLEGRILWVNESFCRVLRGDEQHFLGRKFQDAIQRNSPDTSSEFEDLISGAAQQLVREEEYTVPAGGSTRLVVNVVLCRDQHGNPAFLIAQIEDISRYKRWAEENDDVLHDLEERVKELTALHDVARLLQSERPSELVLQELVRFLPAAWRHAAIAGARILFDGAAYTTPGFSTDGPMQRVGFTTAGGRHCAVEIAYRQTPPDSDGRPFLGEEKQLLESVAEMLKLYLEREEARRHAEEMTKQLLDRNRELWSLQQELSRVEQRVALGWMTGAIAHELGTPLNSVLGYTQLLAQEELSEKGRRHVHTIAGQVQRMAAIVQYYLDRTRGSTGERRSVNLNELVTETLLWLDPVLKEKHVRVLTHLAERLPSVNAHAGSLQRVLINLINNAMASLHGRREIAITTRMAAAPEQHQPGVAIEVTDTGTGIAPDVLPRVFDLFMTTRPPGGGTGLGLAVSQEIVREHGGKITISSELDRGTTVTIVLPASLPPSEES